jgi:2-keto-myo-inositol isomerase
MTQRMHPSSRVGVQTTGANTAMRRGGEVMKSALNHMTTPRLGYAAFLDLSRRLGCLGVEVRNDLELRLFDGADPQEAGQRARDTGLRLVGLSQVYPFNAWSETVRGEVEALIRIAKAAGVETISLIPRNDGDGMGNGERQANLRLALREIKPLLEEAELVALVEPLGFSTSSLRRKAEALDMIDALNAAAQFRLVHDTFHHHLAGETEFFPEQTGIVHLSAVVDPDLTVSEMRDEHRVLVDARDRLENLPQIEALLAEGYDGVFSYECFSPEVHGLANAEEAIARSFEFIKARVLESIV